MLAVFHGDDGADLEGHVTAVSVPAILISLPVFIQQTHHRAHTLACAVDTFRIDHHQRGQTGHFVDLLGDSCAFFHILETHRARIFGDDRTGMRIPGRQHHAGAHRIAFALTASIAPYGTL